MSDRISIAALKERAEEEKVWEDTAGKFAQDVLALVEAVEAAHAHVVARRDRLPSEWPRLLVALARFDFGLPDSNPSNRSKT